MGAHNTFTRIAIDQVIEQKTNKNTQTTSGTKVLNQIQWYAILLLQTIDDYFWMPSEMITFYNRTIQQKDLSPARDAKQPFIN